jgi:hypothetical protein
MGTYAVSSPYSNAKECAACPIMSTSPPEHIDNIEYERQGATSAVKCVCQVGAYMIEAVGTSPMMCEACEESMLESCNCNGYLMNQVVIVSFSLTMTRQDFTDLKQSDFKNLIADSLRVFVARVSIDTIANAAASGEILVTVRVKSMDQTDADWMVQHIAQQNFISPLSSWTYTVTQSVADNPLADILNLYPAYLMASAESWDSSQQRFMDLSGNGRVGTLQAGAVSVGSVTGNGAGWTLPYVGGTTGTQISWGAASIPSTFTICSITRYSGAMTGGLLNEGSGECWGHCGEGTCPYCGTGRCCRKGWEGHGCDGTTGFNDYHSCVAGLGPGRILQCK